jgi:transcriptional regulator with XRE-family HTH domain
MANSTALIDALKRELRARDITYAQVARHLSLSEPSVKRLFSRHDFTLERIDRICQLLGMEFTDLARSATPRRAVISRLSIQQEQEFVANPKLMLVAVLVLDHWKFDDMLAHFELSETECIQLLARLDHLKFIELLPNNRYRALVSDAFAWIPDGPIQRLFKRHLSSEFFESGFAGENEFMVLANGALATSSVAALIERLRRVAAEFAEMRANDAPRPLSERPGITLLLAARPWEPALLEQFRRRRGPLLARTADKRAARGNSRKQVAPG